MQLESEEPSHRTFLRSVSPSTVLLNKDSLVAAYMQGSGADKTDAGTSFQQDFLDEHS